MPNLATSFLRPLCQAESPTDMTSVQSLLSEKIKAESELVVGWLDNGMQ